MNQITVTKRNGAELAESVTLAIYSDNIVSTRDVGGLAEIVYADTLDRRIKPITYLTTNTKEVIDGYINGDVIDFTKYDPADGSTSVITIQEKFVRSIRETYHIINGVKTACVQVKYIEGAFSTVTMYVSDSIDDISDPLVTTTTTTAKIPATTTTTTTAVL